MWIKYQSATDSRYVKSEYIYHIPAAVDSFATAYASVYAVNHISYKAQYDAAKNKKNKNSTWKFDGRKCDALLCETVTPSNVLRFVWF